MRTGVFLLQIMTIVRAGEGNAEPFVNLDQSGIGDALMLQSVCLHFQIEMLRAKDVLKLSCDGHRTGHIPLPDEIGNLTAQAAGKCDQPFVVFLEDLLIHSRLVIESLEICFTDEFDEILIPSLVPGQEDEMVVIVVRESTVFLGMSTAEGHVRLAADDGFHSCFFGLSIELNRAEHVAVVRHGYGRLTKSLDLLDQRLNLIGAVEEAELRMQV